ncbi:type III-B CRISPR module RAMP protein Cmr4 [Clostridium sp.]|uniref:type III-B CRISPR module RAMP protein Cmr4 n=1 Tax=Clostridium sp. TaxID=1506 RepID=UPI002FDCFE7E
MSNFEVYIIKCLTNMHVGSGNASYSIIDNQVQRDVITNFPTINSSSLKGSLREYLKNKIGNEIVKYIFGDDKEHGIGKYKIFPGMLLSIPVRSDQKPFFRATCQRIIRDFKNLIDSFHYKKLELKLELEKLIEQLNEEKSISNCIEGEVNIENYKCNITKVDDSIITSKINSMFGQDLIILDDATFLKIVSELPIIARNKLENGESQNLWYEEVVPRESRFYFGVINGEDNQLDFKKITEEPVQIGGNATIGYGYCNIEKVVGD